jgi:uncharacterized protein
MKIADLPPHIDVSHCCHNGTEFGGQLTLASFQRLMQETQGLGADKTVDWSARCELISNPMGQAHAWLHLTVSLGVPLTCQRCLGAVTVPVSINRSFRFVETEAQAELEDESSVEDVLVLSRDFDLSALIEDEVLMDLPVVPRHDECPVAIKLIAADADFEEAGVKPNPFAALADLKSK